MSDVVKKFKLNCAATAEETFADFLTSRKAKGHKTLQSFEQQFRAAARLTVKFREENKETNVYSSGVLYHSGPQ